MDQPIQIPTVAILIPYSMEVNLERCLDSVARQDYPAISIVVVNSTENLPSIELENSKTVKNVVQGLHKNRPTNIVNLSDELNDDACNIVINDIVKKISIVGVLSPLYEYSSIDVVSKNVLVFMDFPQQIAATYGDYQDVRKVNFNKIGENYFVAGGALKHVESLHNLTDKIKRLDELHIVHHMAECHTNIIRDS